MTRNKHFRSVFAALLCAVLCMTAFATVAYFKLRKPKSSVKGGDELDEFDFDDDEDEESYGDDGYELDDPESKEDTEE